MSKITRVVESLDTEDTGVCDTNLKPKGNDPKGNSSKGEISTKMLLKKKKNGQKQSAEQKQAENHVCKLVEAFLSLSKCLLLERKFRGPPG